MSQDSNVTYEVVRRACATILGRGEKPSRPSVQAILASDEYLGHKGSNSIVQQMINAFWVEVGDRLKTAPRDVTDVPEPYVATIDKALADMVTISRKIADEEMAAREAALVTRQEEMQAEVQSARDLATASDQLRLRAEGERNALEARLREQAAELSQQKKDLQAAQERESRLTADVRERDIQIKHLDAAVAAAKEAAATALAQHTAEVKRLLQQVDDARQREKKEAESARGHAERAAVLAKELESARTRELDLTNRLNVSQASLAEANEKTTKLSSQLAERDASIGTLEKQVLSLEVKTEEAEKQRDAANDSLAEQLQEIGRLRGRLDEMLSKSTPSKESE